MHTRLLGYAGALTLAIGMLAAAPVPAAAMYCDPDICGPVFRAIAPAAPVIDKACTIKYVGNACHLG